MPLNKFAKEELHEDVPQQSDSDEASHFVIMSATSSR